MTDPKKLKLESIKQEVKEFHPLLDILLKRLPDIVDVEYTHGTTEMGADFVFSRKHPLLGHEEYVGVIVKIGKIVQDFSDVDRQIEECSLVRTFLGGKQKIRINEIWVVITENISKGAQEKIYEKYKAMNIQFIGGEKLIKLIDSYFPAYWTNTTLQVGEYISTLHARNNELDRQVSLIPVSEQGFYIEQDLYEFPRYENRKSLRMRSKKPGKVNLLEEVKKHNFILIEGGVGSGKSKLLRYLTNHYTLPDVFTATKILPITTSYKEFNVEFQLNFESLINNRINEKLHEELLNQGVKYLILIDAFDEKNINTDEQIDEISQILQRAKSKSNIKVILTSRYLSELDHSNIFEAEIRRFDLASLSMNRTIEFVKKLCTNLNLSSRLLEDLKKSQLFREMPRSPIAAILLAKLINENPKDIPSSLTELYSQFLELILGRWEIDKGLETQKEYQALDNILIEYAKYVLDFEMPVIPAGDAKAIVKEYLSERNLDINPEKLYEKLTRRCEIISTDSNTGSVNFKHRSFAEYFYARHLTKPNIPFEFEKNAFGLYWMNTVFFYLGIRKDDPELITKLGAFEPETETERWIKVINMSNYMLSAYATPYSVISEMTTKILLDAGILFDDIVSRKLDSPFSNFSRMQFLHLMQYLIRESYSFDFFRQALEDSIIRIDDSEASKLIKAYSMFFLNVAYIDLGATESFDMILRKYADDLPMDINLAIHHESKDLKEISELMKKQDRKVKRLLKDNSPLKHELKVLYEQPIKLLSSKKLNP